MTRSTSLYFNGGDFSGSAPQSFSRPSMQQQSHQMPITKSTTMSQINNHHASQFNQMQQQALMTDLSNSSSGSTNRQAASFNNMRQNPSFYNCNTSQSFLTVGAMFGNNLANNSLNDISESQQQQQSNGWSGSGGYLNKAIGRPIRGGVSTNGINQNQSGCFHKQPSQWPTMTSNNLDLNLDMRFSNNQLDSGAINNSSDQHSTWLANLESNSLLIPAYSEVNTQYQLEQLELLHLRQAQEQQQQKLLLAQLQYQLQQQQVNNLIASSFSSTVSSSSSFSGAASSSSNTFLPATSPHDLSGSLP
jgi:hypothetical protein